MSYFGIPIRNGLPIGLGSVAPLASGGGSPFSPLSLFSGGAPGAWYDPSDLTTLFQDSAGTTPVTAVEQPVGLMLDKSQGLVLSSEKVTNPGPFTNTTGWSTTSAVPLVASGGVLTGTTASATVGIMYGAWLSPQTIGFFEISVVITAITGRVRIQLFGSNSAGPWIDAPGTYVVRLCQTASSNDMGLNTDRATTVSVSSFSVKQIAGNHAFQVTSASRPVLSARYNLLTKTEEFDDAVWTKTGGATVQSNVAIAPDGTTTADELTLGASGAVRQIVSVVASSTYVWVKAAASGSATHIRISTNNALAWGTGYGTKVALTSEWQRISAAGAVTGNTSTSLSIGVLIPTDGSNDPDCYGKVLIWGADLKPSNQSTLPYQRVNTSTDYATAGFLPYLKFDGVDDSLSTNSISFTSTDKVSVFAGVRKLSDATGFITETSSDFASNSGTFAVWASVDPGYRFGSKGTASSVTAIATRFASPITNTLTGLGDISGDLVTLRVNGAQVAQNTSDQGSGNYGNYPLYIGRRNNASLPFNGQMYSMIIVGKAVTAGELSSTETYVATKTGVTL